MNVVQTVAALTNTDPIDLPPLGEVIDTDALDAIFASRLDGTPRPTGEVTFQYAGIQVTVSADDSIAVDLPENADDLPIS